MQKYKLLLFGSVMCCAAVMLAQTVPSMWPFKGPGLYGVPSSPNPQIARQTSYVAGHEYMCMLEEPVSPLDWEPSAPLPLGLANVEEITRAELRKLVKDEPDWLVTAFQVSRFGRGPGWYYTVTLKPEIGGVAGLRPESYTLLVDFVGKPGKLGRLVTSQKRP